MTEYLAATDVLAMPSRDEGFGLAALEAMAMGVPPVAAAVGGLLDIVEDGCTGVLVPPDDAPALAAALQGLLANPAQAREMGAAARQRVEERWDAARLAEEYLHLYENWLVQREG